MFKDNPNDKQPSKYFIDRLYLANENIQSI